MKLSVIQGSAAGWQALSGLKKNPKLAYRLLKYEKKVEHELKLIEKHRESLVYKHAGMEPPAPGEIKPVSIPAKITETYANDEDPPVTLTREVTNPALIAYQKEFDEFLDTESDLEWIGITMDELIDGLAEREGNVLAEMDIDMIEPFFTEPKKTELTVVK